MAITSLSLRGRLAGRVVTSFSSSSSSSSISSIGTVDRVKNPCSAAFNKLELFCRNNSILRAPPIMLLFASSCESSNDDEFKKSGTLLDDRLLPRLRLSRPLHHLCRPINCVTVIRTAFLLICIAPSVVRCSLILSAPHLAGTRSVENVCNNSILRAPPIMLLFASSCESSNDDEFKKSGTLLGSQSQSPICASKSPCLPSH
mmetsp:Transcript_978/g.950  ORF Transcript_978/g.950 Transcript_978/m.950 type:complete len:202 (+) Transcript_978:92-697(+)